MKLIAITLALAITSPILGATFNFDDIQPGSLPDGWIAGCTGSGKPKWAVTTDTTAPSQANVLKQTSAGTFPWCVVKDGALADGFVEVKFKSLAGKEDQAAGVIWRWQDGDNYYVARANALEDNVRIYHVTKCRRVQFQSADLKVTPNAWHTLRVDFAGRHFTVSFDGKKVLEADDDTIKNEGAVGVWTKADSVTAFDDFRFEKK